MEARYQQSMSLEDICKAAGLSKSTLLRAFTSFTFGKIDHRFFFTSRKRDAILKKQNLEKEE